jgi:hypothetical protein
VKSRVLLLQQLSLVMGIALLIQGLIGYVSDGFRLPVRVMLPAGALTIVALFAWRIVYSAVVLRVVGPQRILFVGMSPLLEEMASHIKAHPELGLQTVGYVVQRCGAGRPAKVDCSAPSAPCARLPPSSSPIASWSVWPNAASRCPSPASCSCATAARLLKRRPPPMSSCAGAFFSKQLRPAQIVFSSAFRPRPEQLTYQTVGNWFLALILGILSAPLLLLAAILLRLSSRGPLLIRKECAGLGGKPFTLYRLRLSDGKGTMNRSQKFVRRWRLDALPHLWNILRGEMGFVGPRAERPEFIAALTEQIPFYRQRCRVRPGITGWAQINMPPDRARRHLAPPGVRLLLPQELLPRPGYLHPRPYAQGAADLPYRGLSMAY